MTRLASSTVTLVLVFYWYAKQTMRHEPQPLTKARNTLLVKLEPWSTTSTRESRRRTQAHVANDCRGVRRRRSRARGDGMHLARQQVDVVLDLVEAGGRRRQPGDLVHSDHPTVPRRQRQGMEEPPCSAMVRWHVWHERTYSATSTC